MDCGHRKSHVVGLQSFCSPYGQGCKQMVHTHIFVADRESARPG